MSANQVETSCKSVSGSQRDPLIRGIHHAGLVVDDLDSAIAFYGALLDMEVIERDTWRAPAPEADSAVGVEGSSADGVMLRGSGSYLELWNYHAPAQVGDNPATYGAHERGLRHLAIEVTDVRSALERVVELGGSAMGDPLDIDDDGAAAVYCRDPFGTILELMSVGSSLAALEDL